MRHAPSCEYGLANLSSESKVEPPQACISGITPTCQNGFVGRVKNDNGIIGEGDPAIGVTDRPYIQHRVLDIGHDVTCAREILG